MSVRYQLPTTEDLAALAGQRHPSVTVYAATSPVVEDRERAQLAVKSAFDRAVEELKRAGEPDRLIASIHAERDEIARDTELWGALSRSLAIFVAPGFSEVYVLPNRLDGAVHLGDRFQLGQLMRAASPGQEAFALTLSANAWRLWHATPEHRAEEFDVDGKWAADAAEANRRTELGGRDRPGLTHVGDEGKKAMLDIYARQVADAVRTELGARDPVGAVPLVAFTAEPLSSLFEQHFDGRTLAVVGGAADRLGAAEIDEELREILAELAVSETDAALRSLSNADLGRVERDLAAIARAAADGAVETLYFDFTESVAGTLDEETGAIGFADTGDDVLGRIALLVLTRGGGVVAVRGDDLDPALWSAPAVAALRYSIG